eukprot:TRINITY_DN860_c0_g1_i1.p1 TRINITY_DN860_c0_g1~~TRINITY_DN860_c0_g1_i1.p1  ORF type:complete len:978 (-),score=270.57 TRINITY_DN860_c0_g1_i1:159-3092(-)
MSTPEEHNKELEASGSFSSETSVPPAVPKTSQSKDATTEQSNKMTSRIERKDFPATVSKSQSETSARAKGTPKNLRFRMISPSNSNASTSSFSEMQAPVIVRPLNPPTPVIIKPHPSGANLGSNAPVARKQSFIATVTVNGNESPSSSENNYIVTGNPAHVDFMSEGSSSPSSGNSVSSFTSDGSALSGATATQNQIMVLPIDPETPDVVVALPKRGRTHVQSFLDSERPQPGYNYFQFAFPPNKRAVGVVIPFFNEEERELRRSLESLETQSKIVWKQKNLSMHVLLIMDGWSKASESMREYVKFMFPPSNDKLPWWSALEDKSQDSEVETLFVQRIKPYGKRKSRQCAALSEVPLTPGDTGLKPRKLHITLIVKRDNRRKHNSHEWFFGQNGFAEFYKHEYLFATDCGTLFEPDCLYSLLSHMENNPSVSVATGRQRVMTKAQQGSDESLFSLATCYRLAQCYDYESSFACFMGAFALFGFLPVIPGPCGLYRAADMLGKARDWYFDVVNTDPDKSGMVLGNLRIAEDRVLSYAAVLKTEEPRRMALIPESTFYFEAECQLEKFLLQRRRWTNGTVAGYIYLCVQNPGLLFRANMNPIRKLFVYLLLMCQLLVYVIVALAPGIFLTSLHATLRALFPSPRFTQTYPDIAWYGCILMYVAMVIVHTKTKYRAWMFYVLQLIAACVIAGAFWTFGTYLYLNGFVTENPAGNYQYISIYIVLCVTLIPLVIAFLHSPKSFGLMIISIIPYYLFLPMLVGWFSAYAFARTWDLTWGNRPASAEHSTASASTKANVERELRVKAMTICIFVVIMNLIFILVVEQVSNVSLAVLIIAGFIFSFAALQMFLSSIYFILYYDPRRIIQTCFRVAKYPFKKEKVVYVTESSEEEEDLRVPTTTASFKSDGTSSSVSSHPTKVPSRSSVVSDAPGAGTAAIKTVRSHTALDIKPTRSGAMDEATVVNKEMKTGQVKRTPSVATAV